MQTSLRREALRRNSRGIIDSILGYFKVIDFYLFAAVVLLAALSLINIAGIGDTSDVQKQLQLVGLGILLMLVFSFFNYRFFKDSSLLVMVFYILTLGLLTLTLFSRTIRGINAWIFIGGFSFEPSELAKLALIILLAKYFSQRHIYIHRFTHLIVSGIYALVPTALILLQPDLGSAIIFGLIWLSILAISGINRKQIFLLLIIAIIGSYSAWLFALKPYQKDRISTFVDPYKDPKGAGYNLIQSKIAIGSGYIFGNGWKNGSQSRLGFLPEAQNDFVFAAFTEQFGFAGAAVLLGLVGLILYRILSIGMNADTNFAKLFSVGLAMFFFSHVVVNVSASIGLMPITGLPFPVLSFGGSHLISLLIGVGILQSIKRYG